MPTNEDYAEHIAGAIKALPPREVLLSIDFTTGNKCDRFGVQPGIMQARLTTGVVGGPLETLRTYATYRDRASGEVALRMVEERFETRVAWP